MHSLNLRFNGLLTIVVMEFNFSSVPLVIIKQKPLIKIYRLIDFCCVDHKITVFSLTIVYKDNSNKNIFQHF